MSVGLVGLVVWSSLVGAPPRAAKTRTSKPPVSHRQPDDPSAPPRIGARAATVVDLTTGEVLYARAATEPHAIASISKLMAMRVAWKRGLGAKLAESTTMARVDADTTWGGARSRLIIGREYLNKDLLHAALLGSDNRAVVALGRAVGREPDAFAQAMTAEAKALGLAHTRFVDPTGIDHGNQSTPAELVELLRVTLTTMELANVTRTAKHLTSAKERSGRPLLYRNTNALVHDPARKVLTGKTGFNSKAGWCVAFAAEIGPNRRVAVIVLGTKSKHLRFADAKRLLNYAANRKSKPAPPQDEPAPE